MRLQLKITKTLFGLLIMIMLFTMHQTIAFQSDRYQSIEESWFLSQHDRFSGTQAEKITHHSANKPYSGRLYSKKIFRTRQIIVFQKSLFLHNKAFFIFYKNCLKIFYSITSFFLILFIHKKDGMKKTF